MYKLNFQFSFPYKNHLAFNLLCFYFCLTLCNAANVNINNYEKAVKDERILREISRYGWIPLMLGSWLILYFYVIHGNVVLRIWLFGGFAFFLLFILGFIKLKANELKNEIRSFEGRIEARPPLLILRSFNSVLSYKPDRISRGRRSYGGSFFEEISNSINDIGRPIAIGGPGNSPDFFPEHSVLFYQSEEASWFRMFEIAANAAKLIIIQIGDSKGLTREISTLVDIKLTNKMLFFMPPTPDNKFNPVAHFVDLKNYEDEWNKMIIYWLDKGLHLPPYNKYGAIFNPFNGRYHSLFNEFTYKAWSDSFNFSEEIKKAVNEFLRDNQLTAQPLSEIAESLEINSVKMKRPDWFSLIFHN